MRLVSNVYTIGGCLGKWGERGEDMTANGRIARMVGSSVMMRGRGDCHVPDQLFASSAYSLSPATTSPFAVASTSSIISAVSRPVRVFCWLG